MTHGHHFTQARYPVVLKRSWKVKKLFLQLQNTCILASISFLKKTEIECLDFETKYFVTFTRLQLDSRHSLIYWWCCWILGKGSSNYGKFTRILLKIFYHGLELVGDEKHPAFECYFTEVIPPLITFVDFRDPPTQCLHFPSKFEPSPMPWSFQSFQWSPLLGSQLRLMPPFVLLKIMCPPPHNPLPRPTGDK